MPFKVVVWLVFDKNSPARGKSTRKTFGDGQTRARQNGIDIIPQTTKLALIMHSTYILSIVNNEVSLKFPRLVRKLTKNKK